MQNSKPEFDFFLSLSGFPGDSIWPWGHLGVPWGVLQAEPSEHAPPRYSGQDVLDLGGRLVPAVLDLRWATCEYRNTSFEDARFGHMWKRAPASSFCAHLSTTLNFSLCWCTTSQRLSAKTNQHRRASVGHCQKLPRDKQPNTLPQQQGVVSSAFYGHYTRLLPTLPVARGKYY